MFRRFASGFYLEKGYSQELKMFLPSCGGLVGIVMHTHIEKAKVHLIKSYDGLLYYVVII